MQRFYRLAVLALLALTLVASSASAKPEPLSYAAAKRAIQAKADRFAGQATRIASMFHLKPLVYSGRAEWDRVDPTGCKGCGYDPATGQFFDEPSTESCLVTLVARKLPSGAIRVRAEDFACY